jgi:antitoxin component YwqK of YwqJK toxin-antitoxin module
MKTLLPTLVALSLLVGCSNPSGGGVRQCDFYENGQKKSETYMLFSGIKVGHWSTWYENGRKESEGQYQDGEREGLWTVWYENRYQRDTEGEFRNGEKEGRWTNWYDNGKTKSEGQYQNGEREGRWAVWSEDGSINNEKSGIYKVGKRIAPLPDK